MTFYERLDRIEQLLAIMVKNNITPLKNTFTDIIIRVSASRFGASRKTAKGYSQVLIDSWRMDKWKRMVKENGYLKREEKENWFKKIREMEKM